MTENLTIQRVKRIGAGLSSIAFPVIFLIGFILHPNFLNFELVTEAEVWTTVFRGNFLFHFGHLLILFTVPLISSGCPLYTVCHWVWCMADLYRRCCEDLRRIYSCRGQRGADTCPDGIRYIARCGFQYDLSRIVSNFGSRRMIMAGSASGVSAAGILALVRRD